MNAPHPLAGRALALYLAAGVVIAAACGGTVRQESTGGSTGTAAGGGAGDNLGGSGGIGGSSVGGYPDATGGYAGATGGFGGATGGNGGTCVDTGCGPDQAPCCVPGGEGCMPPKGTSCECGLDARWHCLGGTGGMGGTGGCSGTTCGPDLAPCCTPGMGCANTGPGSISCSCGPDYTWHCSGSGGTGGIGGSGGSPGCNASTCAAPFTCCGSTCVNPQNDPYNCGACGVACGGAHPYCSYGQCASTPCFGTNACTPYSFCCGNACCGNGQLCCDVQGPGPSAGPSCYTPTPSEPTCPLGCPWCL